MRRCSFHARRRRGMILIVAIVAVALLSLAGFTFSQLMLAHREGAELFGRQTQARALADSGVEAARVFLRQDLLTQQDAGGKYTNETYFRGVLVRDDADPALRGRFTLLAPALDNEALLGGLRYGLENESNRLNLNVLTFVDDQQTGGGRQLLMALPGMTEDVADAILDYLDEDDEPREFGAEVDYYSGLDPPYKPKNGPLATVEELLLVRGVTPQLLFGLDANRNGLVDLQEEGASLGDDVDNSSGELDRGWAAYFTLYSKERNLSEQGTARAYLNGDDMQVLYDEILATTGNRDWATFIVAYRQNGPYTGSGGGMALVSGTLDLTKPAKLPLSQVLDLIGARTQVKFKDAEKPVVLESPFPDSVVAMNFYLPLLMDKVTITGEPAIPGRININQAPRTLLEGIPGMTTEIVNEIISRRPYEPDDENPNFKFETWLLTEAIVSMDEMRQLMPLITAGGNVYRAQAVGYFEGGGGAVRCEAILDATQPDVPIVFWRDMTHLGRGYALETLGVEAVEAQQ